MVLFRTRASSKAYIITYYENDEPFRLRLSGIPKVVMPWIGEILSEISSKTISKEELKNLFRKYFDKNNIKNFNVYSAYQLLYSVASTKESVDLSYLKSLISRTNPPSEICIKDIGYQGPVIGTIHSSKGREADNVILNLRKYTKSDINTEAEETKIIFVGASRAKNTL